MLTMLLPAPFCQPYQSFYEFFSCCCYQTVVFSPFKMHTLEVSDCFAIWHCDVRKISHFRRSFATYVIIHWIFCSSLFQFDSNSTSTIIIIKWMQSSMLPLSFLSVDFLCIQFIPFNKGINWEIISDSIYLWFFSDSLAFGFAHRKFIQTASA